MTLKDYARNEKRRKEYVQQPGLLVVGVDLSKSKHNDCIGTQAGVICRKFELIQCREGFSWEGGHP